MEGISLPVPVHNTPFWILSQQCSVELAGWRGSSKIYRTTQTSPDLNHTPVMYSKIKPWIIFFYSITKNIHITQLFYKRTIYSRRHICVQRRLQVIWLKKIWFFVFKSHLTLCTYTNFFSSESFILLVHEPTFTIKCKMETINFTNNSHTSNVKSDLNHIILFKNICFLHLPKHNF